MEMTNNLITGFVPDRFIQSRCVVQIYEPVRVKRFRILFRPGTGNKSSHPPFVLQKFNKRGATMHSIFYLIGLIVVALAVINLAT